MRKQYSNEIKAQITYEICVERKSTNGVAARYGVPLKTVENWVTRYNKDPHVYDVSVVSDSERIKALEKEVKELREANAVLKKTMLMIAKNK